MMKFKENKFNQCIKYEWLKNFVNAVFILACMIANQSYAEDGKPVYLPVVFHAEAQEILTTMCLGVKERTYPKTAWWLEAGNNKKSPEDSFKSMLSAMKLKNRDLLFELSHPDLGRDPKLFDEQARAYFQQFESLKILSIPLAYSFDGFFVFYVNLQIGNQIAYVPFLFAVDKEGVYKFLPYRVEYNGYSFVNDWFNSKWGWKSEKPVYCQANVVKNASYVYSLTSPLNNFHFPDKGRVFLKGVNFKDSGGKTKEAKTIKEIIEKISMTDVVKNGVEGVVKHMTPEGGNRLKDWFVSANSEEKKAYAESLVKLEPFFLFDAHPIYIVYISTPAGVRVMYFISTEGGDFRWANSSHVTDMDKLFKKGSLYNGSMNKKPFSEFVR